MEKKLQKYMLPVYVYKDIAQDVENGFDTSNHELDRTFPKGKNKKVIGLVNER